MQHQGRGQRHPHREGAGERCDQRAPVEEGVRQEAQHRRRSEPRHRPQRGGASVPEGVGHPCEQGIGAVAEKARGEGGDGRGQQVGRAMAADTGVQQEPGAGTRQDEDPGGAAEDEDRKVAGGGRAPLGELPGVAPGGRAGEAGERRDRDRDGEDRPGQLEQGEGQPVGHHAALDAVAQQQHGAEQHLLHAHRHDGRGQQAPGESPGLRGDAQHRPPAQAEPPGRDQHRQ